MVDVFVVSVFHHGGNFVRGSDGALVYQNEKEERFPEMDLDFVNFGDLVTLFKGLEYQLYKEVYWYDPTSSDIESGLNMLTGNAGINAMRENILKNQRTYEFHIYFDHGVDVPEVVEDAGKNSDGVVDVDVDEILEELKTSSSSDDGYESTEDVLYKPPPGGLETDSTESDSNGGVAGCKRKRSTKGKEKIVTLKKPVARRQESKEKSKVGKKRVQHGTRVNIRGENSAGANAGGQGADGPNDQGGGGDDPGVQSDNTRSGGFYDSKVPTEMEEIIFEYESEEIIFSEGLAHVSSRNG